MHTYLCLLLFAMLNILINVRAGEHTMSIVTTQTGDIMLPRKLLEQLPFFRFQQQDTHDQQGPFVCHLKKEVARLVFDRFACNGMRDTYNEQTLIQQLELLVALDYLLVPPTRLIRFARDLKIMVEEHAPVVTLQQKTVLDNIAPAQAAGLIQKGYIRAHSLRNETLELDLLDLGTYRGLELLPTVVQLDLSRVRSLDLSGNLFSQLSPASILLLKGLLPHLEYFDLSDNMIRQITAEDIMSVRQVFPRIKRLKLNGNRIERLTDTAAQKLQGLSLELKRNPLKELPLQTLRFLENIHLFIADTPLARNLVFNPQNAPGFSLVDAEFHADQSQLRKTLRSLFAGKAGPYHVRFMLCALILGLEISCHYLGLPTYFMFVCVSLLWFIGYEFLICTIVIPLLPIIENYEQLEIHSPLDSLIKMVYPNYLEPAYPVTISHI